MLTTLLVGPLVVRPLAGAWMGTQVSRHFDQSGQSVALVSPSIFKEGLGRFIRGLLPPPRGVLQVCQTSLQLTGCLQRFGWLGAQGSWVQGRVIARNTYDGVYSSARCVSICCICWYS